VARTFAHPSQESFLIAGGSLVPDKLIINVRRTSLASPLTVGRRTGRSLGIWFCLWIPVVGKFIRSYCTIYILETSAIEALDVMAPIPVVHSVIALVGPAHS